jgi:transposase
VIEMLKSGARQKEVAARYGVSKNTVAGVWARHGNPGTRREPTTLGQRLDALHERLDRVLAETRGIGRIPELERTPRR